jgi:hypothetical protein
MQQITTKSRGDAVFVVVVYLFARIGWLPQESGGQASLQGITTQNNH